MKKFSKKITKSLFLALLLLTTNTVVAASESQETSSVGLWIGDLPEEVKQMISESANYDEHGIARITTKKGVIIHYKNEYLLSDSFQDDPNPLIDSFSSGYESCTNWEKGCLYLEKREVIGNIVFVHKFSGFNINHFGFGDGYMYKFGVAAGIANQLQKFKQLSNRWKFHMYGSDELQPGVFESLLERLFTKGQEQNATGAQILLQGQLFTKQNRSYVSNENNMHNDVKTLMNSLDVGVQMSGNDPKESPSPPLARHRSNGSSISDVLNNDKASGGEVQDSSFKNVFIALTTLLIFGFATYYNGWIQTFWVWVQSCWKATDKRAKAKKRVR